jgi:hypothetical protein
MIASNNGPQWVSGCVVHIQVSVLLVLRVKCQPKQSGLASNTHLPFDIQKRVGNGCVRVILNNPNNSPLLNHKQPIAAVARANYVNWGLEH